MAAGAAQVQSACVRVGRSLPSHTNALEGFTRIAGLRGLSCTLRRRQVGRLCA